MPIPLLAVARRLESLLGRRVYYVSDGANWSFRWDAHYITEGLREHCGVGAKVILEPRGLRRQIIHYGNRYQLLSAPFSPPHPSNHLFLTWFHGGPDDPDPNIRKLFDHLPEALPRLARIVVSCGIGHERLSAWGVPESQLITIPLGVDLERFHPVTEGEKGRIRQSLGVPEGALCIGYFQKDGTGWGEGMEAKRIKGPDIFLEVMARLKGRCGNLFVLLSGPARGYVKAGLDALGIAYHHRFLDDYYGVVPFYQASDLYLITSRDEGGPKALLEAWACGVPVVSTRVGMPADLIEHGVDGYLADIEGVEQLVEGAAGVLLDPEHAHQLQQGALAKVQTYSWAHIARRYYDTLYAPLLGRG